MVEKVEKYIEDFISSVSSISPFVFSLMLSNKFKGKVLIKESEDDELPDVVVLIENNYYDIFGVIDSHLITKEDYKALDTLSLLSNVRFYHYIKWSFINEECEDQLYHNDIN